MESPNAQWLRPVRHRILWGWGVAFLILGLGAAVAAERGRGRGREEAFGGEFRGGRSEESLQRQIAPAQPRSESRHSFGDSGMTARGDKPVGPGAMPRWQAGPSASQRASGSDLRGRQPALFSPGRQAVMPRSEPTQKPPETQLSPPSSLKAGPTQQELPAFRTRSNGPRVIEMPRHGTFETSGRNDTPVVSQSDAGLTGPKTTVLPAPRASKEKSVHGPARRVEFSDRSDLADRPSIEDIRKRLETHDVRDGSGGNPKSLPVNPRSWGEDRKAPDRGFDGENSRGDWAESLKGRPSMKVISGSSPKAGGAELGKMTRQRFPDRVKSGELSHLTKGAVAKNLELDRQYRLSEKGDVARQLGLDKRMREMHTVVKQHRRPDDGKSGDGPHRPGPEGHDRDHRDDHHRHFPHHGPIHAHFTNSCFHIHYCGPGYYPSRCWYPHWSPWVSWSWHYRCHPIWDPRPFWCRPIVYVVAPAWVYWEVPVWRPLPVVACGTWVDVPPVLVNQQFDLQLLAVRFVDPGHPEENLGPRYRVWFRNNSNRPITQPFNVTLMASVDDRLQAQLPQAGVRVTSVEAGDIQSVDIRLPVEVSALLPGAAADRVPFTMVHAIVDANREINETVRDNNGVKIASAEILPVDPAAFDVQPTTAAVGSEVLLAGEGFGPEPGQVLLHLGGIEMQGVILGWYDLGVRLSLPNLPLASPTEAELIVVRGDGAAANPLKVTLTPAATGPQIIGPAIDLE